MHTVSMSGYSGAVLTCHGAIDCGQQRGKEQTRCGCLIVGNKVSKDGGAQRQASAAAAAQRIQQAAARIKPQKLIKESRVKQT